MYPNGLIALAWSVQCVQPPLQMVLRSMMAGVDMGESDCPKLATAAEAQAFLRIAKALLAAEADPNLPDKVSGWVITKKS